MYGAFIRQDTSGTFFGARVYNYTTLRVENYAFTSGEGSDIGDSLHSEFIQFFEEDTEIALELTPWASTSDFDLLLAHFQVEKINHSF